MRFRRATVGDLDEVLAIVARTDAQAGDWAPQHDTAERDRERVTELLTAEGNHNEAAEADGRVVGFASLEPRPGAAHLAYLFVDPSHQGQGIGAQLLERAMAEASRRGYKRATLATAAGNQGARRFYERAGWKDTGGRRFHPDFGLEMADYARDLDGP